MAEAKYCAIQAKLFLELKICVDVISDVVQMIGKYVSEIETFLNENFHIYSGCLRLAYAEYDIGKQRMHTSVTLTKHLPFGRIYSLEFSGKCKSKDVCSFSCDALNSVTNT